jgi:hypothetical protein
MTMAKPATILLAAALLLAALPLAAQEAGRPREAAPAKRGFGPLEKSLLIPGWGQTAEGRYLEGLLSFGLEAYCVIKALHENSLGNEAYLLYQASSTVEDAARYRADTESRDTRRNRFLLAGAAVWALNLLDVYLIVRGKTKAAPSLSLKIRSDETHALMVMAGCRF